MGKDRKNYQREHYIKNKEKKKEYYLLNREKIKEKQKDNRVKYRLNNKEKIKEKHKEYRIKNKEKIKQYYIDNKERDRERINEYRRNHRKLKRENDPLYKLVCNIRCLVSNSLRYRGYSKKSKTYQILGCSFEEFKLYLESKFEVWMSWDNYGKYNGELNFGWDIDHIIPISKAITEEEIINLNHFENLQPLCSYTNRHIKK